MTTPTSGRLRDDVRWGIYFNAGQVCSAMSRVIVHESRHDELVERAGQGRASLSVGPGIERPRRRQHGRDGQRRAARPRRCHGDADAERRARGAAGGGRKMNRPGAFLEPTVMTDVTPDMDHRAGGGVRPGPVRPALPRRRGEAIEIANGTDYGLVAGVFTRDLDRATRAARRLRAGQVFVNEWYAGGVETPFGGYGKSGYGREKGREALWNYVQTKNVAIRKGR
jgi:aldehyde dehydrogenase (NAD+)